MQEIAVLILKFRDSEKPDEYLSTELSVSELKMAIHFFEERKRKNIKGGRSKKIDKWVQRILTVKHYLIFQELESAYKTGEIGRDSYYHILHILKSHGYNRKLLDSLYQFTLIIRKWLYLIVNYDKFREARAVLEKASQSF
jgi:hypothetical protein